MQTLPETRISHGEILPPGQGLVAVSACPHPFKAARVDFELPAGLTVAEMIEAVQPDPVLRMHAHVYIGPDYVPRDLWTCVRPKPGALVAVRIVPHGGDSEGGKDGLSILLTIAVIAVAFIAVQPELLFTTAFLEGSVIGTLTAADLIFAGIGLVGTLLVNAIVPPSRPKLSGLAGDQGRDSPTLFIAGARNRALPFGVVPRVLGKHRMTPPLGAKQFTEIVGADQFVNALVTWGYGPLDVTDLKIGETPIGSFDGVTIETRQGFPSDQPLTIFPDDVFEDPLGILLTQAVSWQLRTGQPSTDSISVDIVFGSGLVQFDNQGVKSSRTVSVEVEYSVAGAGTWVAAGTITTTAKTTSAVRKGLRWDVARDQYDVRLRRTTPDTSSSQILDQVTWTALRSFTDEDPISFPHPLAKTAIRIKATGQLTGIVDQLNAVVTSILPDWDEPSQTWIERATSNPASIFREVLQGTANARPLPDARIDLAALQAWHEICAAEGREFNMVRDFAGSVQGALDDVAAAGRAARSRTDGKWGVVVDTPGKVPVQHFTPRNSFGFSGRIVYPDLPHAWRVRFVDRDEAWRQNEMLVFDDGFDATNATEFEGLELAGVTDAAQVWRDGRYHIATARLRRETFTFSADVEHIVCTRGDMILLTHDVIEAGLASGRIKSVIVDGGGNATGLVLDEVAPMEAGKSYGISIRTEANVRLTEGVDTDPGDQTTITLTNPIPAANVPAADDLFGFGELGQETLELLIKGIEPKNNLEARIVALAAAPAVHDAGELAHDFAPGDVDTALDRIAIAGHGLFDGDTARVSSTGTLPAPLATATDYFIVGRTGADLQVAATAGGAAIDLTSAGTGTHTIARQVPAFVSNLGAIAGLDTPLIDSIRSDATVLLRAPDGSLEARILVTIQRTAAMRPGIVSIEGARRVNGSDEPWVLTPLVSADDGEISIEKVETGETYDLRFRYVDRDGERGAWTAVFVHTVIGKTGPPADVGGFSAAQNGTAVNFRWDQVPDLDLAGYEIRLNPQGAIAWADATPLTEVTRGTAITNAQVPPGDWTFLIKALDTSGNESTAAARADALVLADDFDVLLQAEQAPHWPGTLNGFVKHYTGVLVPESQDLAAGNNFDVFDNFVVNPVANAIYEALEFDVDFDDTVRVWADVASALGPGETLGVADPALEIDYRKDAGAFDGFEPWTIGDVDARFIKFRINLDTSKGVAKVTGFKPTVDLNERAEGAKSVAVGAGGQAITFAQQFHQVPRVAVTVEAATALIGTKDGVTTTGFTAHVFDSGGAQVGGTVDWQATGA